MALTYKNQVTGRNVEVLEPDELAEAQTKVRRRGRPIDPKLIGLARKRRKRTIDKMDDSWKWQRVDGETQDEQAADDNGGEPSAAEVRAWATERGIDVPSRGRLPDELVAEFKAAQES